MRKKRSILGLVGICTSILLLSLLGLAADFLTHLTANIDGLLLLFICLMMLLLFAGMLVAIVKEEGWLPSHRESGGSAAESNSDPSTRSKR